MSINFKASGDAELWRIRDVKDEKEYCWPLMACKGTYGGLDAYLVWPALPVNSQAQQDFVFTRLRNASYHSRPPQFVIRESQMRKIGCPCKDGDADSWLKWPDDDAPETEDLSSDREFLVHVCNKIGFSDLKTARLLYTAICHHAVDWMAGEGKPLNLGFGTIRAYPYRENWKAILHAKFPESYKILGDSCGSPEAKSHIMRWGIDVQMKGEDMLAVNKDGTFAWSLDITPSAEFDKLTAKAELESLSSATTKASYLLRLSALLNKSYEHAIKSFAAFVQKASAPLGSVAKGRNRDNDCLVPRYTRGRVRPHPTPPPVTRLQTDSHAPDHEPIAKADPDASPFEDLQDVPDGKLSIGFSAGRRKPDLR